MKKFFISAIFFVFLLFLFNHLATSALADYCKNTTSGQNPVCYPYAGQTCSPAGCTPGSAGCNCGPVQCKVGSLCNPTNCANCSTNSTKTQCNNRSNCPNYLNCGLECYCIKYSCTWVNTCNPTNSCNSNWCGGGFSDGCGGTYGCGSCGANQICQNSGGGNGRCVSCTWGSWQNGSCGGGTCGADQIRQTRSDNCGNTDSRCVTDTAGAWQNGACAAGTCGATEIRQTRTTTYGCLANSRCVADTYTQASWQNGSCGGGTCGTTEMRQTRNSQYSCLTNARCVADTYTQASWQNGSCGGGTCGSTEMRQTRNSEYSCLANSRCVADTYTQSSWQNATCGGGTCASNEMRQTRSSTYSCLTTSRCVADTYTQSSWQNDSCGAGTCANNEMRQTRGSQYGCLGESRCETDTGWGAWVDGACGGGSCAANQRLQTRKGTPYSCRTQTQCVTDNSCGNYSISGRAYVDVNNNNQYNAGTDTTPSITVERTGAGGSSFSTDTTTNSSGVYSFSVPAGNNYDVRVVNPDSCSYTVASTSPINNIDVGPDSTDNNFRLTQKLYTISGNVYIDDGNGNFGAGDTGWSGTVRVYNPNGTAAGSDTSDVNGGYSIGSLSPKTYSQGLPALGTQYTVTKTRINGTVINCGSGGLDCATEIQSNINAGCANVDVDWLLDEKHTISGRVYIDSNNNHVINTASDASYTGGATLTVVGTSRADTSDATGAYSISNNSNGDYQVSITGITGGYTIDPNYSSPQNVTIAGSNVTLNFLVDLPTYTINGNVFIDDGTGGGTAGDGIKNGGEVNVPGAISISGTDGNGNAILACPQGPGASDNCLRTGAAAGGAGRFTVDKLRTPDNNISLSYSPSTEYFAVWPTPPNMAGLSIGDASCFPNGAYASHGATCTNGNIATLNFAVRTAEPWIQTIGANIRWNGPYNNPIPPSSTSPQCSAYNSLPLPAGQSDPGLIYLSGNSAAPFGGGSASSNGRSVRNQAYPSSTKYIRTSYSAYLARAQKNGTVVTIATNGTLSSDGSNFCASGTPTANCQPRANLPKGTYSFTGNMSLGNGTSYTFNNNGAACTATSPSTACTYTILVNGNVTINSELHAQRAYKTVLVISSSRDITVSSSLGVSAITDSTTTNLEGIFSADRNFVIAGKGTPPDNRLNIAGAVIADANPSLGGAISQQRDLLGGNQECPAFSVIQRPDFFVNYPKELKESSFNYTELAP